MTPMKLTDYNLTRTDFKSCAHTWSVQKVSRILNFASYVHSIFDFFVALCWYSYPSLMPTSSAILNVQLIFDSYFARTCFGSSPFFAYYKKWIKESVSHFKGWTVNKEYYLQVMRNCVKQSSRNSWICGKTKIGFCTTITPPRTHRCLCANFWSKTTQSCCRSHRIPQICPLWLFLVPETEEGKIEDEPKRVRAK